MTNLKLGRLDEERPVKVTVELPAAVALRSSDGRDQGGYRSSISSSNRGRTALLLPASQ